MPLYVTNNGLIISTKRLVSDFINSDDVNSGKLSKVRLWDETNYSYIEGALLTGYTYTGDDDKYTLDFSIGTDTDLVYGNDYDKITLNLRFMIKDNPDYFDTTQKKFLPLSSSFDVHKVEILNENNVIFATYNEYYNEKLFTVYKTERTLLQWKIDIGNDLSPTEWPGVNRSAVTQFGIFLAANRLLYDSNLGPFTSIPGNMLLFSQQESYSLNSGTFYRYYHNGTTWVSPSVFQTISPGDTIRIGSEHKFDSIGLFINNTPSVNDDFYITLKYYDGTSWKKIVRYVDATNNLRKTGIISWYIPTDWEKCDGPTSPIYNFYYIDIIVSGSGATYPILDTVGSESIDDGSLGLTQKVDTERDSIKEVLTISPTYTRASKSSPSVLFVGEFYPYDVGYVIEGDSLSNLDRVKVIKGSGLSSIYPFKQARSGYKKISGLTRDSVNTIKFSNAQDEPWILLALIDDSTYEVMKINQEDYRIDDDGTNYIIHGFVNLESGHTYSIYYLRRNISFTNDIVNKISAVRGPSTDTVEPIEVFTGYQITRNLNVNPLGFIPLKDIMKRTRYIFGKSDSLLPEHTVVYDPLNSGINIEIAIHHGNPQRKVWVEKASQQAIVGEIYNCYLYKYIMFRFDATTLEDIPKFRFGFESKSSIGVTNFDIYLWTFNGTQWSWEKLGEYTPRFGQEMNDLIQLELIPDGRYDKSEMYILVYSNIPNIGFGKSLKFDSGAPVLAETLSFDELRNDADSYKTTMNGTNDILFTYAKLVGMSSATGLIEYKEGVDYKINNYSTKNTITLLDSPARDGRNPMPVIGTTKEVFNNVGSAIFDEVEGHGFGKWSDGTDITAHSMEFAVSKIPLPIPSLVKVLVNGRKAGKVSNFKVFYRENYQLAIDDNPDNHIKFSEDGRGCYTVVVDLSGYDFNIGIDWNDDGIADELTTEYTVEIIYPYLKSPYIEVDYIERIDYGLFSKSYRAQESFGTPIKIDNRDFLHMEHLIEYDWPRSKDPSIQLDESVNRGIPIGAIVFWKGNKDKLPTNYRMFKPIGMTSWDSENFMIYAAPTPSSLPGWRVPAHTHWVNKDTTTPTPTGSCQMRTAGSVNNPQLADCEDHSHSYTIVAETSGPEDDEFPLHTRLYVIQKVSPGTDPHGAIVPFGAISAYFPNGWKYCDGTDGTIDLTGEFIRSAGEDAVGSTGGASTHKHSFSLDLNSNWTIGTRVASACHDYEPQNPDNNYTICSHDHEFSGTWTSDYKNTDIDSIEVHFLEVKKRDIYVDNYGTIVLWPYGLESIPRGWQACDGTNGTPDFSSNDSQNGRYMKGTPNKTTAPGTQHNANAHYHDITIDTTYSNAVAADNSSADINTLESHKHTFSVDTQVSGGNPTTVMLIAIMRMI